MIESEDKLLTDEEIKKITYEFYHEESAVAYVRHAHPEWLNGRIAQAQLDKILEGGWKDKPTEKGWWWTKIEIWLDNKRHIQYQRFTGFLNPIYFQNVDTAIIDGSEIDFGKLPEGKWSKAIVPNPPKEGE